MSSVMYDRSTDWKKGACLSILGDTCDFSGAKLHPPQGTPVLLGAGAPTAWRCRRGLPVAASTGSLLWSSRLCRADVENQPVLPAGWLWSRPAFSNNTKTHQGLQQPGLGDTAVRAEAPSRGAGLEVQGWTKALLGRLSNSLEAAKGPKRLLARGWVMV